MVLVLVPYAWWLVVAYRYHFLDGVNLAIHETGHLVFSPFGETLPVLGGTILQLAFPAAFVVHFALRKGRYEAAICFLWLSESVMYTARYLGDAPTMALPLVGGGRHDWNWLLLRWGILHRAGTLETILHAGASVGAVAALVAAYRWADPDAGREGEPA